jgi:threonine dehydratase
MNMIAPITTMPTRKDIEESHQIILPLIHRTPVLTSSYLNSITGCDLFFKCENLQKVGAFKMRGASNAVLRLAEKDLKNGVATHSSGNHAAALALAAKIQGIPAYIVMPSSAPKIKKEAVNHYGGKVIECFPTLESREATLQQIVDQTGATFIHPFDNYSVIGGQATAAKELIEEIENLNAIFAPVGGGGLLSGTALASKYFSNGTNVFGAEPLGASDAWESFHKGKLVPVINPKTIADGLLTSLSEKTFQIIRSEVKEIFVVNEEEILAAMRLIWERMKIIIEPSSAVPFAAIIRNKSQFKGQKIGIILSGGNIDLDEFQFA